MFTIEDLGFKLLIFVVVVRKMFTMFVFLDIVCMYVYIFRHIERKGMEPEFGGLYGSGTLSSGNKLRPEMTRPKIEGPYRNLHT